MRKMDELHYKSNWSGGEGSGLEKVNALIVRMNRIYDAYENHLNQFHKQTQEPECKCYHNAWEKVTRFCEVHKEKPVKIDELAERLLTRGKRIGVSFEISVHDEDYVPLHGAKELADEARKWAVEIVKEWFPSSYLKETYVQELVERLKESK